MTPAFPAGHALQATLIARCLKETWGLGLKRQSRRDLLDYLAQRLGENRIIAGLHFPLDITAGERVATACYPMLAAGALFGLLLNAAEAESV